MNKSVKTLTALAVAGLVVGANVPVAFAGEHAEGSHSSASKDSCKGKSGCNGGSAAAEHKEKDSCKGKAGCNGKDAKHAAEAGHAAEAHAGEHHEAQH